MSSYDAYGAATRNDQNCRTCTDFQSWSKKQRQIFHTTASEKKIADSTESDLHAQRKDCPLDRSKLGKYTWSLLHTIAAFYPDNPNEREKRDVMTLMDVMSRVYPCEYCAQDFQIDIKKNPVNASSQKELSLWLCNFHNRVNEKVGKPMFDCSKVNERWRDGWLDGSCD